MSKTNRKDSIKSSRTKSEGDTISGAGDYDLKYAIKR